MPTIKFTERSVSKLKAPDPSGDQVLYWDSELRGFGVLCSGVSNSKNFVVQRTIRGRSRRITIGATNVLTLDEAKQRAETVIGQFLLGIDPRARRRGEMTLAGALDAYLESRGSNLQPRSIQAYREGVERHLKSWADTPLRAIDRGVVEDLHKKIAQRVASNSPYDGHATANATMRALRLLYTFAADRADAANPMPPNPVRLRRAWFEVAPRTGRVADADLPKFYAAIMALKNAVGRDYLLLVLFTGLRRREAAALAWENVDLRDCVIRLPLHATKSGKPLDLPMSSYVRDLLIARRAHGDARWVFPSVSKSGHVEEPRAFLMEVAKLSGVCVTVHDLRRTFVSIAESCDLSHYALKALVNHSLGRDVTAGYVQMSPDRLRDPAQRVCDRIKALCAIEDPIGTTVARLPR